MTTKELLPPEESQPASPHDGSPRYEFARTSAVPNAGEGVLGSARHLRNAWRGLEEAERDGTAEELVTRDNLLRNEPASYLSEVTPANAILCLAAHLCLSAFPVKPEDGRDSRRDRGTTSDERRAQFYGAYRNLKAVLEAAVSEHSETDQVIGRFNAAVVEEVEWLRGGISGGQRQGRVEPNPSNAIANQLVTTYKRTKVSTNPRSYRKNDIGYRVHAFKERVRLSYGDSAPADRVAEHVRDVLQGLSLDKTFGVVAGPRKQKPFDPGSLYTSRAERLGGRPVPAETAEAATGFMRECLGFRAVQFGNAVPDRERARHLKLASEAFADLADVLGLADEDISLGGRLAIAFGARGHGTALAHYEPSRRVINLTRKRGVGSLAHEWAHFFDNMLGTGGPDVYLSESILGPVSFALAEDEEMPHLGLTLERLKYAYTDFSETLQTSGFQDRLWEEVCRWMHEAGLSVNLADYFMRDREIFARAFECHVMFKLVQKGCRNTYLSGVSQHAFWPSEGESAALAPAFDAIFSAFKGTKAEPFAG